MKETEVVQTASYSNYEALYREWINILEHESKVMMRNFMILDSNLSGIKINIGEGANDG